MGRRAGERRAVGHRLRQRRIPVVLPRDAGVGRHRTCREIVGDLRVETAVRRKHLRAAVAQQIVGRAKARRPVGPRERTSDSRSGAVTLTGPRVALEAEIRIVAGRVDTAQLLTLVAESRPYRQPGHLPCVLNEEIDAILFRHVRRNQLAARGPVMHGACGIGAKANIESARRSPSTGRWRARGSDRCNRSHA